MSSSGPIHTSAPMPTTETNEATQPATQAAEQADNGNLGNPATATREENNADLQPGESARASQSNQEDAGSTPEGAEPASQPAESPKGINPGTATTKDRAAKKVAARKAKKKATG